MDSKQKNQERWNLLFKNYKDSIHLQMISFLSMSTRIERELIRKIRLEIFPFTDASMEYDLWFSPFVEFRSITSISLFPDFIPKLHHFLDSISMDKKKKVRGIIEKLHRDHPKLAQKEEELYYKTLCKEDISQDILSITKTLMEENSPIIPRWAKRVMPILYLDNYSDEIKESIHESIKTLLEYSSLQSFQTLDKSQDREMDSELVSNSQKPYLGKEYEISIQYSIATKELRLEYPSKTDDEYKVKISNPFLVQSKGQKPRQVYFALEENQYKVKDIPIPFEIQTLTGRVFGVSGMAARSYRVRQRAIQFLKRVNDRFPQPEYENWEKCEELFSNAEEACENISTYSIEIIEAAELLSKTARYLSSNKSKHNKAIKYYKMALKIYLDKLDFDHPDIVTTYNNLGSACTSIGDYYIAIEYTEKALKIQFDKLNADHPDVAITYSNLGSAYSAKGDYDKAINYLIEALKIQVKIFGNDHPSVAATYNNFGLAYQSKGEYDEAIKYHEKALKIRLDKLGIDHPDVATTYSNLGSAYSDKGDYDKAIDYFHEVLKIQVKIFGNDHSFVATTHQNIGEIYESKGDYSESLKNFVIAIDIRYSHIVKNLKNSEKLGNILSKFLDVRGESSFKSRGLAMLMISDDDLPIFESDKNYKNPEWLTNNPFTDLLVPLSRKIKNPIIFWITRDINEGCIYHFEEEPIVHHIIQIGKSYFIEDVIRELFKALKKENISIIAPWFIRLINKKIHKSIYDISKYSKDVIGEIETSSPSISIRTATVDLLESIFKDEDIDSFCRKYFPEMRINKFTMTMHKNQKIWILLDYCDFHGQLQELYELLKRDYFVQYENKDKNTYKSSEPKSYFQVPLDPNPFFTGREDLLQNLYNTLHTNTEIALSGMDGVGKTQTAIQYAYLYREKYSSVFWVLAEDNKKLKDSFAKISDVLGYQLQKKDEKIDALRSWLKKNKNWLLIFDNADTLKLINSTKNLLPKGHEGHVLYITRAQTTGNIRSVSVDCFDLPTASKFLLRRSNKIPLSMDKIDEIKSFVGDSIWNYSQEIVSELGGLALAIDQAGAYIEQTSCSFSEYLELYREDSVRMLKDRKYVQKEDHLNPVYKTFLLAIEKVEKKEPLTRLILENIAFGHPDRISISLFDDIDKFALNQALKVLKDYSLINIVEKKNLLTIHRLVQTLIKDVCI